MVALVVERTSSTTGWLGTQIEILDGRVRLVSTGADDLATLAADIHSGRLGPDAVVFADDPRAAWPAPHVVRGEMPLRPWRARQAGRVLTLLAAEGDPEGS